MKTVIAIVASLFAALPCAADLASDAPAKVQEYLSNASLTTGRYKSDGDMVRASSKYRDIASPSSRGLSNNIAYYIEGSHENVAQVKLVLNVNSPADSNDALKELADAAALLVEKAVGKPMPEEITKSILKHERNKQWRTGSYDITLSLIPWNTSGGGYEVKFIIDVRK
jgi:hypothetical protein